MSNILYMGDVRGIVTTVSKDSKCESIVCTFCGHQFDIGEKCIQDNDGFWSCTDSVQDVSSEECYR